MSGLGRIVLRSPGLYVDTSITICGVKELHTLGFCFVCFDVARGVCQPTGLALSEVVARMPSSPAHNLLPRLVSTSAGIQQAP